MLASTVFREPTWSAMAKALATWLERDFLPHSPDEVDYTLDEAIKDQRLQSVPGYNSKTLEEFLEDHKNTIKNIMLCRVLARQLQISKQSLSPE